MIYIVAGTMLAHELEKGMPHLSHDFLCGWYIGFIAGCTAAVFEHWRRRGKE